MSRISYKQNLDRINPQFLGIAEKYNTHKKNRLDIEKEYKNYSSNKHYMEKLNETLEVTLQKRKKQLEKAKIAHQRHTEDVIRKMEDEKRKQQHLQYLQQKSLEHRIKHKSILNSRITDVRNDKKSKHMEVKKDQQQIKTALSNRKQQEKLQNQYKFHMIETQKQTGLDKINTFYKQKNSQFLHNYMVKINEEDKKSKQYLSQIKKMKKSMKKNANKADKRSNQIQTIEQQLKKYNTIIYSSPMRSSRLSREVYSQTSKRSNPKSIMLAKDDSIDFHSTFQQGFPN